MESAVCCWEDAVVPSSEGTVEAAETAEVVVVAWVVAWVVAVVPSVEVVPPEVVASVAVDASVTVFDASV